MLSSNDPYNPENLLHCTGKIFRSVHGVHRIIKAANSPEYRKISVNAALIKGRGIFICVVASAFALVYYSRNLKSDSTSLTTLHVYAIIIQKTF